MKNKNKKILIGLFIIFSILFIALNVKADSGYDLDFGGGGSGGGDIGGIIELLFLLLRNPIGFVFVIIIIVILVIVMSKKDKKLHNTTSMGLSLFFNQQLPPEQIYAILGEIDINQLLNDRFNDYVEIQNGWMNFNHDLLRTKLTDELYNEYAVQLDTMQIKNQQNVMSDFNLFQGMITGIIQEGNKVTLTMEIITGFFDYLTENGQVVRGKNDRKVVVHYELTFVCNLGSNGLCPNCGAKLPETNVCDFCHSVVPNVGTDWVMSKKETLKQK
jgi:hypothetical protein